MNLDTARAVELHELCNLKNVRYMSYSAHETENPVEDSDSEQGYVIEPEYKFRLADERSQGFILTRAAVQIDFPLGNIHVDVLGEYHVTEAFPAEVSADELREFARLSAARDFFPYLRMAVQDLSTRVFGNPIVLPTEQPFGPLY